MIESITIIPTGVYHGPDKQYSLYGESKKLAEFWCHSLDSSAEVLMAASRVMWRAQAEELKKNLTTKEH